MVYEDTAKGSKLKLAGITAWFCRVLLVAAAIPFGHQFFLRPGVMLGHRFVRRGECL